VAAVVGRKDEVNTGCHQLTTAAAIKRFDSCFPECPWRKTRGDTHNFQQTIINKNSRSDSFFPECSWRKTRGDTHNFQQTTIKKNSRSLYLINMGSWSWDQFSACPPTWYWEAFVTSTIIFAILIAGLVVALLYPVVFNALHKKSEKFRSLSPDQQLTTLHHAVEFVVLSVAFAPFTYTVIYLNFAVPESIDAAQPIFTMLGVFMVTIMIMYFVEMGSRFRSPRPLVLFHHITTSGNAIFLMAALSTVNIRACAVFTYFVTFESPLFLGLVMYRICPERPATRSIMQGARLLFGLTRPVQLVWALGSIAAIWGEEHFDTWIAAAQIVICVFFTTLQLYTIYIYGDLIRKLDRNKRISSGAFESPYAPDIDTESKDDHDWHGAEDVAAHDEKVGTSPCDEEDIFPQT
jgi:hypothetical protein